MGDWNTGTETWGNGPATSVNVGKDWEHGSVDRASSFDDHFANAGDFCGPAEGGRSENRGPGGCFNCGEEGHIKADCTNPRVFTGECRNCGMSGHRASDCTSKPKVCKQCGVENDHNTIDCKNKKTIDTSDVPEMSERDAWKLLKEASDDLDVDDFKDAVKILSKAVPELTYGDLEKQIRKKGHNMYLIALKKEVSPAYTNVDLQGEVGKTYTLGVFPRNHTCPRPILMPAWPETQEENMERLKDVGVPMERGIPICNNCGELGHTRKGCEQEQNVVEAVKIVCALCSAEGHRVRDCPEERPQKKERVKRTCRFCESEDHIAKECPDAPKPECRNCFQIGHKAAECTNEKVFKCRNCDQIGHVGRECKEPKDWSRVTCRHCGESGHASEKMCNPEKKAHQEKLAADADENRDDQAFGDTGDAETGGGWDEEVSGSRSGGWESGANDFPVDSGQASWETNTTLQATTAVANGRW